METKFFRTISVPKVVEGAHRLAMSVLLATTTMPKTAISTFPILAALGHVTDKLQKICGWNPAMTERVKLNCKVQNKKLVIPGLFQRFFDLMDPNGAGSSPTCPSPTVGRYYKLMLSVLAQAKLKDHFWRTNVRQQDLEMAQKLFNKPDSDIAIITSEILELCESDLAVSSRSTLNVEAMSEPGTHLSGLDNSTEFDVETQQQREDAYLDASLDEGNERWTDNDMEFFNRKQQSALFRVNGDCCLYYDYETNAFCDKPAVENTARCIKHKDTANTKFMQILMKMHKDDYKVGFSLSSECFRHFVEPSTTTDYVEYAPSLEGPLSAFKHSENSLRKSLIAGYQSYQAGYLTKSSIPFRDNFFKEQFPNEKISTRDWMYTYLSLRVSFFMLRYFLVVYPLQSLFLAPPSG